MSELGPIWSSKGDTVVFGLNKKMSVRFGEIVKINSGNKSFYARVTNSESGSTLGREDKLKEAEGRESFGPYSIYRDINAVLFLEKSYDGTVRSPTFNPAYGDHVFRTTVEDHKLLNLQGDFILGSLRSGEEKGIVPVGIQIEAVPRHIGMFGMTGAGKTNAELILNARIIDNPNTVGLIFDFSGELLAGKRIGKGFMHHPLFPLRVAYYGREKIKVGINSIWTSHLRLLFSERDLTDAQKRLARRLDKRIGRDNWISEITDKDFEDKWPDEAHKSTVRALQRKLDDLNEEIFIRGSSRSFINDVIENLEKGVTCLIDVSELSSQDQKRIACLVAYRVSRNYEYKWRTEHETWKKLPVLLITLEEAHEFLSPEPEKRTFFSDITLRYRKYNVGLNIVTPRPSRINLDVFAEVWTKLILKTTLSKDRDFITKNTPYLEYSDIEVKLLEKGEAILVSEPQLRFAVPIKLIHYPDYIERRGKNQYNLSPSKTLSKMDINLKRIRDAGERLTSNL